MHRNFKELRGISTKIKLRKDELIIIINCPDSARKLLVKEFEETILESRFTYHKPLNKVAKLFFKNSILKLYQPLLKSSFALASPSKTSALSFKLELKKMDKAIGFFAIKFYNKTYSKNHIYGLDVLDYNRESQKLFFSFATLSRMSLKLFKLVEKPSK